MTQARMAETRSEPVLSESFGQQPGAGPGEARPGKETATRIVTRRTPGQQRLDVSGGIRAKPGACPAALVPVRVRGLLDALRIVCQCARVRRNSDC
jgi:hypothetical protein